MGANLSRAALTAALAAALPAGRADANNYVRRSEISKILQDIIGSSFNRADGTTATATAEGISELATDAEMVTGSATDRAATVAGAQALMASVAEVNTGTATTKAVTPDALAGSNLGTHIIILQAIAAGTNVTTGDGKLYYHVPAKLNGMNIITVHALNSVAGITGQCDVQIANVTSTQDVLSTVLSVDTTEVGSDTGATPAVIDAAQDDLATNDILRIDVDAVHSGTAPKGLTITLECRLP